MVKKNAKSSEVEFEEEFEKIAGPDCSPIQTTLLKMIEDGNVKLTDVLFFELVKESSHYLQTKPFQDKVSSWLLKENRKMLNRIQTALKPERRGRKATKTGGFNSFKVKEVYLKNVKLINDFKEENKGKFNSEKNELFKKLYPTSNIDFSLHESSKQLAYILTSQELNISERTLRKITKYVHFVYPPVKKI